MKLYNSSPELPKLQGDLAQFLGAKVEIQLPVINNRDLDCYLDLISVLHERLESVTIEWVRDITGANDISNIVFSVKASDL